MWFSVRRLREFTLHATDGSLGTVSDVYFDETTWTIQYVVIDTGRWLPGRRVLLAPFALGAVDIEAMKLTTYMNRDQVRGSPLADTMMPVSRQQQQELYSYWGATALASPIGGPTGDIEFSKRVPLPTESVGSHLRSAREIAGYYVEAIDGDSGHVEDFIADDENWAIRHLVVETRNWLPGRNVLVSPQQVSHISWTERRVRSNLTREQIRQSPEWR